MKLYSSLVYGVFDMVVAYPAIDFVDDFNNREMILHKKFTL